MAPFPGAGLGQETSASAKGRAHRTESSLSGWEFGLKTVAGKIGSELTDPRDNKSGQLLWVNSSWACLSLANPLFAGFNGKQYITLFLSLNSPRNKEN